MLRPFVQISIQQVTTYNANGVDIVRNKLLTLDFVTEYEIPSGWESHTNEATIKFPKNIVLQDGDFTFTETGTYNVILGGVTNQSVLGQPITYAPLLMKGDIVYIADGYWFRNENQVDVQKGKTVFSGYISEVKSEVPIQVTCNDNFYLLKRTPFDSTVWNKTTGNGKTDLYSLMQHILDLVNAKFNSQNPSYPLLTFTEIPNAITAEFSLGYLDIGDLSCGQLLDKLKSQFHFESTFVGNTLLFGATLYNDDTSVSDANLIPNSSAFFAFRDIFNSNGQLQTSANIHDKTDLEYTNKDDIQLSTIVQCKIIQKSGKTLKSGATATKLAKLKILVFWDIPTSSYKYQDLSKPGTTALPNPSDGERHSCWYPVDLSLPSPTLDDLFELGKQQLSKYHYTGFKGSFVTLGFPFVDWNDNVNLLDPIMADRNGVYKVRKVIRKGGTKGITQEIHLDYLLQDLELGVLKVRQIPSNVQQIHML